MFCGKFVERHCLSSEFARAVGEKLDVPVGPSPLAIKLGDIELDEEEKSQVKPAATGRSRVSTCASLNVHTRLRRRQRAPGQGDQSCTQTRRNLSVHILAPSLVHLSPALFLVISVRRFGGKTSVSPVSPAGTAVNA